MSISEAQFPRDNDGALIGEWCLLMRTPINHDGAGFSFRHGASDRVTGPTMMRLLAAFGPDVLALACVQADSIDVYPSWSEIGEKVIARLNDDPEIGEPWCSLRDKLIGPKPSPKPESSEAYTVEIEPIRPDKKRGKNAR